MTTPMDLIINGSLIKAAYETYNQPFSVLGGPGYPIGFLFIIFMVLLYLQNRNIAFHFLVSLFLFAAFFVLLPNIFKGIILVILLLELAGILYSWVTKD